MLTLHNLIFYDPSSSTSSYCHGRLFLDGAVMLRSNLFCRFKPPGFTLLSITVLSLILSLSCSFTAFGAEIKLSWDPNTESDLAGYKIYYGVSSGSYGPPVNVGNVTSYTLTGLTQGQTYFITATAFNTSNTESGYSNEVSGVAVDPEQSYDITSNIPGLQITVDGIGYRSPQTFRWNAGSSHKISVLSPQSGSTGTQYVFSSWSDGGNQSHTIKAPPSASTYTAGFTTQYSLTTSVRPIGAGIVTPAGVSWYSSGKDVPISAGSSPGYSFLTWKGDLRKSTKRTSLTMNRPKSVTARFRKIHTLSRDLSGLQMSVDETKSKEVNKSSGFPDLSKSRLPMIGALESPSEGKRVLGLKTIYGWALDGEGILKVKLYIDDKFICDIPYGGLTEGLKEAYPDYPDADRGGFALVWNYSGLSPGSHLVQVEVQNLKGEVLNLRASVFVQNISGEMVSHDNTQELLIPGVKLTVNGNTNTYDLRVRWSTETDAFEIIDFLK